MTDLLKLTGDTAFGKFDYELGAMHPEIVAETKGGRSRYTVKSNTTVKIAPAAAVAASQVRTAPHGCRSRNWRIQTHTMNGSASPAVAFTATARAIRLTPAVVVRVPARSATSSIA